MKLQAILFAGSCALFSLFYQSNNSWANSVSVPKPFSPLQSKKRIQIVEYETKNNDASNGSDTLPNEEVGFEPPEEPEVNNGELNWTANAANLEKYLGHFRNYLTHKIVDQAPVVEMLTQLERDQQITGLNGDKNSVFWLLGPSKTGKDHIVHTYVDAINGREGAWKDHVFDFPVASSVQELWRTAGSVTGFAGSQHLTPLIRFLVEHSGGRYKIVREDPKPGAEPLEYIIKNTGWTPENVFLKKQTLPERAVLFFNNFHLWSRAAKDSLLKDVLTNGRGLFQINNPGKGLSSIEVPVTIAIASNDAADLVSSRNVDGHRVGRPLDFQAMQSRWKRAATDAEVLRDSIFELNRRSMGSAQDTQRGTSPELVLSVPAKRIVLMGPISQDGLALIVQHKLEELKNKLLTARGPLGAVDLDWDQTLVDFIVHYDYRAEDQAGQVEGLVTNLVQAPLNEGISLLPLEEGKQRKVKMALLANPDGTVSMNLQLLAENSDAVESEKKLLVAASLQRQQSAKISDQRIEEVLTYSKQLKSQVFGVDDVIDRVQEALLAREDGIQAIKTSRDGGLPAKIYLFLGLSSTGKSRLIQKIANQLYNADAPKISFGQIRTVEDLKQEILGSKDHLNRPIKSKFMEEYDKTNGKLVVDLDEIANCPREVLMGLYDLFREPVITTFSDGKERPMSNVLFIASGNAGEEWYKDIPRDIPEVEQLSAMNQIYKQMMKEPNLRRATLESYFSEALINRIGESNIFFFGPLTFKALRQISILKLEESLARLRKSEGRRSWNIHFADHKNSYPKIIEFIESEGFVLREQGASIDRFVNNDFENALRALLLKEKVADGAKVTIEFLGPSASSQNDSLQQEREYLFNITTPNHDLQNPLVWRLKFKKKKPEPKDRSEDKLVTGFHEAGHELVRHAKFADKYRPSRVSIVPGVTQLNGQWIRYAGIAEYEPTEVMVPTREGIIDTIAYIAAGDVAESLVSKQSSSGASNDWERASELASRAVLQMGLSPAWGKEHIPSNVSIPSFLASLSEQRKKLFEKEKNKLLNEGRARAKQTILANFDSHFIPMGLALSEAGELSREKIEEFYSRKTVINPETDKTRAILRRLSWTSLKRAMASFLSDHHKLRSQVLLPFIPRPQTLADAEVLLAEEKNKQTAEITFPDCNAFLNK